MKSSSKYAMFYLENEVYQFQMSTLVMYKGPSDSQKTNKENYPKASLLFIISAIESRKSLLLESLILSEILVLSEFFGHKMFCQNMNIVAVLFSLNFLVILIFIVLCFIFIYLLLHCFKNTEVLHTHINLGNNTRHIKKRLTISSFSEISTSVALGNMLTA